MSENESKKSANPDERLTDYFELIYGLMTGVYDLTHFRSTLNKFVKDEYAPGEKCHKLYTEFLEAFVKMIPEDDIGQYDESISKIMDTYEDIQHILCFKSFLYGYKLANHELPDKL